MLRVAVVQGLSPVLFCVYAYMGWSHFFICRKAEVVALFAKRGFISEVTLALEVGGP